MGGNRRREPSPPRTPEDLQPALGEDEDLQPQHEHEHVQEADEEPVEAGTGSTSSRTSSVYLHGPASLPT